MSSVKINGESLNYASDKFKDDENIVIESVK